MEDEISYKVIGAAIEVHKTLGGPVSLEGIYESCLCHELAFRKLKVERQVAMPNPLHKVQLLTYLKLTGMKLGLLINYGIERIKEGISRVVNGL